MKRKQQKEFRLWINEKHHPDNPNQCQCKYYEFDGFPVHVAMAKPKDEKLSYPGMVKNLKFLGIGTVLPHPIKCMLCRRQDEYYANLGRSREEEMEE